MRCSMLVLSLFIVTAQVFAPVPQPSAPLQTQPAGQGEETEQGEISVSGKNVPYQIRMLPLSAFPDLPLPVKTALAQRHCLVPQTYEARRPENVTHGQFLEKGSNDWAALCSSRGTTSLVVFSGAAPSIFVELASHRDVDRLSRTQAASAGFGYNWGIDVASPARVRELSGQRSGNFDHDGIEDSTIERFSAIHYYRGEEWLTFELAE